MPAELAELLLDDGDDTLWRFSLTKPVINDARGLEHMPTDVDGHVQGIPDGSGDLRHLGYIYLFVFIFRTKIIIFLIKE